MPRILHRVPIATRDDIIFLGNEMVQVKAYEVIAWVSLSTKRTEKLDLGTLRFPAILDIAHTHNFSIQAQHLACWAPELTIRARSVSDGFPANRR